MAEANIAIRVENLGKRYRIGGRRQGSFRESFSHHLNSLFSINGQVNGLDNNKNEVSREFWALKNIDFEIKAGEAVGIIGRNGAGKSTLLKILSRITKPTTGRFEIFGRVSSLLEVGTGFHPELTGRENVYLNGTILGMKRAEVKAKFDEIVAFSGVERFIDTPVKHYSSGMQVRLAFAVAAHLEPEILIIDEVLAVGDAEFQKKCLGKMEDVAGEGRTVLFVSHNMGAVRTFCTKGILLKNGALTVTGDIDYVVDKYLAVYSESGIVSNLDSIQNHEEFMLKEFSIQDYHTKQRLNIFRSDSEIEIVLSYILLTDIKNMRVNVGVLTKDEQVLFTTSSHSIEPDKKLRGKYKCSFIIPKNLFNAGTFKVRVHVGMPGIKKLLEPTVIGEFSIEKVDPTSLSPIKLKGFISPEVLVKYIN